MKTSKTDKTDKTGIEAPQKYEAPAVEIFEIVVEKGFADYSTTTPTTQKDGTPNRSPSAGGPWH